MSGHARSGIGDPDLFVTKIEVSRQWCSIGAALPVMQTTHSADLARARPQRTLGDHRVNGVRRGVRNQLGPQADP